MKRFEIQLLFIEAPRWPALADPPSIQYAPRVHEATKGGAVQPLLKDRLVLEPDINLNRYRCSAVIDWIEVQIDTAGKHQAINIQRFAKKLLDGMGATTGVYVSGPTRASGYIGSSFIVRVQQPEARSFVALCKNLVGKYDPDRETVEDLPIVGIEVSVDFYVKNHAALGLDAQNLLRWQMTDVLRRHLKPGRALTERENNHPRFFTNASGQGSAKALVANDRRKASATQLAEIRRLAMLDSVLAPLRIGAHSQVPIDTTSYIGEKNSAIMLRVMDKTTDQRDPILGTAIDLPPAECRSRLEVTFIKNADEVGGPAAVGLEALKDLFGYPFKPIRRLVFEFFHPTINSVDEMEHLPFPVNFTELDVFRLSGVYGLDRVQRSIADISGYRYRKREIPTKPRSIGIKGKAVSFEELNRKIDRSLSSLASDWKAL